MTPTAIWITVGVFTLVLTGMIGLLAQSSLADRRNRREGSLKELTAFLTLLKKGTPGEDFVVVKLLSDDGLMQFLCRPDEASSSQIDWASEPGPIVLDYPLTCRINAELDSSFRQTIETAGLSLELIPEKGDPDILQAVLSDEPESAAELAIGIFSKTFQSFQHDRVQYRWSMPIGPQESNSDSTQSAERRGRSGNFRGRDANRL